MLRTPSAKQLYVATAVVAVGLGALWLAGQSGLLDGRHAETRAALGANCIDCHDTETKSGGLVLEPAALASIGEHAETWEKVARKIAHRAMPPPGEPRPDETTYRTMQAFLESELDAHAAAAPNAGYLPPLHRLTRTEYKNAIRDLLALENLPAELDFELLLPADNVSSGFDNIAELLFVSPAIMERYLDAAKKISRLAVGDMHAPLLVNRHRMPLQLPQDTHVAGLPLGTRGGLAIDGYFPLDADYVFSIELAGFVRDMHELEILIDGESVARATVGPPAEPGFPRRPAPIEFRLPAKAGPAQIGVTFVEHTEAIDESTLRVRRRSRGTLPDVELITITGPYDPTGPGETPSRRLVFSCKPGEAARHGAELTAEELACAREILARLARRAYRRPATEEDFGDLLPFFAAGRAERGFELGIERALERLLVSPQFLYRIELDPAHASPGRSFPLSDLELASRLSFFLWSSIPDDALLDIAIAGRLRERGVLDAQVARMLADPKSAALVTNFAAQWLFLRDIEDKDPDLFLFRDYDEPLRAAFAREAALFVDSIFRENHSVLDLITATHTFLDERLAEHYGIPNIEGSHFRRIALPEGSPRIGLLGKGGILTLTSYATRTSPVLRGKYVLENLLGAPPPAPPPNVPSLVTEDETDGAPLTIRAALVRHRADPNCATCHAEMDALGFALENFDAIGQWRTADADTPIDARSELPDGTAIDGVAGLRALLVRDPERFARAFTEKLLMYALGRNVQYYDAPAVRAIVRKAASDDYAFASIVTGIVHSVPFQMRTPQPSPQVAAAGMPRESL
jgi:mono/diheme cytochrome c family protein